MLNQQRKLNEYISQYLKLWDFFGVIQVRKNGEIIYEKSSGYACMEFEVKNTMSTCFSLASISKQFTAFAIMILYDRGFIDIDCPANRYLPLDMKIDAKITVHHLLTHTSGLYNFYNFENDFFGDQNRLTYSKNEYFNEYINRKVIREAGMIFDYNNANYNLLAWIIENISGLDFDVFLQKNIFEILGMSNTFLDNGKKIIKNRAYNYLKDYNDYVKTPYYNEQFSIGAGAIVSNCEDLYQWYLCLKNKKILSDKSYSRFFTENLNHYCYGLEHHKIYNTDKYAHGGDHLGISTYMQSFFDEDISIVILANNEGINQYALGDAISDILHNVEVKKPFKQKEIHLCEEELNKFCGTYLKDKIKVERKNGKLYFVRFKDSLHIELYPVGENEFLRRYYNQKQCYKFSFDSDNKPKFFGYTLI